MPMQDRVGKEPWIDMERFQLADAFTMPTNCLAAEKWIGLQTLRKQRHECERY